MLSVDAFWFAHDDVRGEPRTSQWAAGVMVAASLLAELMEVGAVEMVGGDVVAVLPVPAGVGVVGAEVIAQITGERQRYPLSPWLQHLAADACERVGEQLAVEGAAVVKRRFSRPPVFVAPVGDARPAWVYAAVVDAVRAGRLLEDRQRFLLGLAQHSSMRHRLFEGASPARVQQAVDQVRQVWPPWQTLIDAGTGLIRQAAAAR